MNENEKVKGIIDITTDKVKGLVDSDTVIGDPIVVGDVTLIPVSKTSFGVAAGGSDIPSKQEGAFFGGGSGAGASITPVAFLAVKDGEVRLMQIYKDSTAADRAVGVLPELFDKITGLFKKSDSKSDND